MDPLASQCVPLENQWLWLVSGALWWVCESLSLQLLLVGASGPSGVPVGPSGESVSPLFRLYRVSYFPTFPTKWLFFLLLSYFSRFCPTIFIKKCPQNVQKYIYATICHKKSKKNSAARRGAIKMRLGWAAAPSNYQKFLPFLFDSYFFSENPTKFLLNLSHSYRPTF